MTQAAAGKDLSVNVHHLTRVEGHGNIVVNAKNGEIIDARFEIVESPRFFEAMLKGRHWREVQQITSRICGICAVGHTSASVQGTETALAVPVSEQARTLRKIVFYGEQLQSHILHTYFLAAPDYAGAPSVIPLATKAPDVVKRALRLKKFANKMDEAIVGRHVHPIGMIPGGFTKWPAAKDLKALKEEALTLNADIDETVKLFATFKAPEFYRETEFVSLRNAGEYAFYEGDLYSSDTKKTTKQIDYRNLIKERMVDYSTSKHCGATRDCYMAGALARFNNHHEMLHPRAKKAAEALGLRAPCYNTFMISHAQVVEAVHCYEEALHLIDVLLEGDYKTDEKPGEPTRMAGRGVGACEVPRGLLIHDYTYENCRIAGANLIIPTGMNLANMDADLRAFAPKVFGKGPKEAELLMEMLIRAYDPCISCSCHLLHVEFVEP
jgi:coenzyme F420-reducing hydrogenase alpha subunit